MEASKTMEISTPSLEQSHPQIVNCERVNVGSLEPGFISTKTVNLGLYELNGNKLFLPSITLGHLSRPRSFALLIGGSIRSKWTRMLRCRFIDP